MDLPRFFFDLGRRKLLERPVGEREEVIGSPGAPEEGLANSLGGVLVS